MAALVLWQMALACGVASLGLREGLGGLNVEGAGGIAAVSGGIQTCLVAFFIGCLCAAGLALFASLVMVAGTLRVKVDGPGAGWGGPSVIVLASASMLGLVAILWHVYSHLMIGMDDMNQLSRPPAWLALVAVVASTALLSLLPIVAVVSLRSAGRGRPTLAVSLTSLALLGILAIASLAGVALVRQRFRCFAQMGGGRVVDCPEIAAAVAARQSR